MPTPTINPTNSALQAVGQALISSINPQGSTFAQLTAVRTWIASNQTASQPITLAEAVATNGPLSGNPVAAALVGNYKLTISDINAFYSRYNVQQVIDQDGSNGTQNTGLQVLRAIDTQTGKQALFVAGADPASEFIPVGTRVNLPLFDVPLNRSIMRPSIAVPRASVAQIASD